VLYCEIHRPGKPVCINRRSFFTLNEEIGKFVVSRQAADMSYKNTFATGGHRRLGSPNLQGYASEMHGNRCALSREH
jgi:hypothetical protein